jgi:NADPH:quinone reductase-like Zn-dependent oxidoreductase
MKAILQDEYGSADVLRLGDIDKPEPAGDHVLIQVHAAGVDPGVWHLMTGLPYLVRIMGFGFLRLKTRVRGRDVAGTVEAVGKNVSQLKAGDQVFGICDGAFAEYVCGKATQFAPKPTNLSFEQAAAVPISGLTALHGLREAGQLKAGQKVRIIGASGGVGTFAVQLAKAFGAEVTGVCSTAKMDLVGSIGAGRVIDYSREDCTDGTRHFDLILDTGVGVPCPTSSGSSTFRAQLSSWAAKAETAGSAGFSARCSRPFGPSLPSRSSWGSCRTSGRWIFSS